MTTYLSSSRIGLYLQCGFKYKCQYIDNLPKPFRPSALAFGSAVHSTLNWLHERWMKGKDVTIEMLYKIFNADWYSQKLDGNIRFKTGEQELALVGLAKEFLTMYTKEHKRAVGGSEIPFTVPLTNPTTGEMLDINLHGFLDLVEADGTIVEFKTAGQALSQFDVDSRLQLTAYSYAYETLNGKPPRGIKVVGFIKTKKPRIMTLETNRDKNDYAGLFNVAKAVLKGIQAEVFSPVPGYWCMDCEYRPNCPLWKRNIGQKQTAGAEAVPSVA